MINTKFKYTSLIFFYLKNTFLQCSCAKNTARRQSNVELSDMIFLETKLCFDDSMELFIKKKIRYRKEM